ncbi:hypothetical protein CVT26_002565 [Gymnopilus dilepis]|uniref:Hexosyltransferase n=1 Tax=Gymnopilus dilepis TaxID=231916 RepID=A0A409VSW9_9AGAR|nr:hypothetical protein CVT26_002565 [Gymnopilus dilepis]
MYPPSSQYSALATDPEEADYVGLRPHRRTWRSSFLSRRSAFVVLGGLIIFVVGGLYLRSERTSAKVPLGESDALPQDAFRFNDSSRPDWLDVPPPEPLVLRIAVITRLDAFERRRVIRETVFHGVRERDVSMHYRFVVGAPPKTDEGEKTQRLVQEENDRFDDILMLHEIDDIPERISEKRYGALKWGGSVPNDTYDYFVTLDSDTFVRFGPLARRLPVLFGDKTIKPREDPLLIGRMGSHLTYFLPTVPDGNENAQDEDEFVVGPWFSYPIGIGYMLSSSLVKILLSTDPPLPHHIHYPSDDVMIGSWLASLRLFHDETIEWKIPPEKVNETHHTFPKPFLPQPIDTLIIDDIPGWHDFPARGGQQRNVTWDSVCIHHIKAPEMEILRGRPEFQSDWEIRN